MILNKLNKIILLALRAGLLLKLKKTKLFNLDKIFKIIHLYLILFGYSVK